MQDRWSRVLMFRKSSCDAYRTVQMLDMRVSAIFLQQRRV